MYEINFEKQQVKRIKPDGTEQDIEISSVNEHFLTIIINDVPVMRLNCTKGSLRELVAGRLVTEGIIDNPKDIFGIYLCKEQNEASVVLNNDVKWEKKLQTELSCCTGNKITASKSGAVSVEDVRLKKAHWEKEWIFGLTEKFRDETMLHEKTQGTHTCILGRGPEILFVSEDIGRHNALDKAIGHAVLEEIPLSECILFTSGRVPLDMAEKVIKAGVPVMVSKSVPTTDAIELAKKCGLTLICRAWPDSFELITG